MTPPLLLESSYPPRRAVRAWLLFDWAAQPFFTLVTTFIFAPFFVAAVAANAAEGQALWGYATAFAGLCIALLSPILGAIADEAGGRKPWIAVFGGLLIAGSCLLWFAVPGAEYALAIGLCGYVIGLIGAEFATAFNNAMMPTLVPPERIGRLSGTGWAIGYLGGLISLAFALGFLATDPATGLTLLGMPPLLGLDSASRAGDRAVGPFSALWFLIFVLPMFLFVPDQPRRVSLKTAARSGIQQLGVTLSLLPKRPHLFRFLLANMVYADALVALFAFGGIYAAGVFGWGAIEIGVFGIALTISGTFGALVGGRLDDKLGSRTVIATSLIILVLTCIGIMGTTRDTILFVFPSSALKPHDGLYATPAEQAYLGLGLLIGMVAGPLQAASRAMLVRSVPSADIGQFFGLFALSGKVTSFVGPLLVALATDFTGRQQAGLAVLAVMFGLGLLLLPEQAEKPDAHATSS